MKNSNPNLFVVGAAKAGTTSIYHYLEQHPEINMCRVKEPHFFSNIYPISREMTKPPQKGKFYHSKLISDENIYLDLFDFSNNFKYWADCSTSYLYDQRSAKNILTFNPDSKIIISLRNPIERALSHYLMDCNSGLQFKECLLDAIQDDFKIKERVYGKCHLYIDLGLYADQIKIYYNTFKPENIHVVIFEDLIKNTQSEINKIFDFLKLRKISLSVEQHGKYVPASRLLTYLRFIKRKLPIGHQIRLNSRLKESILVNKHKAKPKLSIEDSKYLHQNYFAKDIQIASDYLGIDLYNKWNLSRYE
ncbi:sulfotransferase [uncultured Draconibacterium sp.]|uniref:sulfotransferase family protein n=1 Tax=uncultured Draconibacterium sp. TaxID=1573823 RepID=UPI0032168A45